MPALAWIGLAVFLIWCFTRKTNVSSTSQEKAVEAARPLRPQTTTPSRAVAAKKVMAEEGMIELTPQMEQALSLIEGTSKHLFITGKAGTGKSTFLKHWRSITEKRHVVLAPTGIAALNVRGQTIHKFFRFGPSVTVEKIKKAGRKHNDDSVYNHIDTIVIDEVSMVRADLLDCIDTFLRRHGPSPGSPFGGVQMIYVGDPFQLPPVSTSDQGTALRHEYATPYFFSARGYAKDSTNVSAGLETLQLDKVFRQKDPNFISILDAVRNNSATDDQIRVLNSRVDQLFQPPHQNYWVQLTTTNRRAGAINAEHLTRLPGVQREFLARIEGELPEDHTLPTEESLCLKPGAQVMFVNNDSWKRWVNGTTGKIVGFLQKEDGHEVIKVQLSGGDIVEVIPNKWEVLTWRYNPETRAIENDAVGSFRQYPLRLAWAVTIHKSQGMTFDRVAVDIEGGIFAAGQLYVALSRCRTFEGLVLKQSVQKKDIIVDKRVVQFMNGETIESLPRPDVVMTDTQKISFIQKSIASKNNIRITYQKSHGEVSTRIVTPKFVGSNRYEGSMFMGVRGYCNLRKEERVFRIDRIVDIAIG